MSALKKLFYFLVIFLLGSFIIYRTCHISQKDIEEYKKIMQKKDESVKENYLNTYQQRKNVQKDIFVTNDEQRLHYRICSKSSHLNFSDKKIVENLENLSCFFQDKVEENQHIRYFQAKVGTWTFPSYEFVADHIDLSFYQIPGTTLPEAIDPKEAYLKGFSEKVFFYLADKTPHFNAKHLRAKLDIEKGLP